MTVDRNRIRQYQENGCREEHLRLDEIEASHFLTIQPLPPYNVLYLRLRAHSQRTKTRIDIVKHLDRIDIGVIDRHATGAPTIHRRGMV
ncbi:MAG: hypothetical protein JSR91_19395 [Proteobacteria bacterium]|nr:hypothetical protein [Pseudomonadota bacterium]